MTPLIYWIKNWEQRGYAIFVPSEIPSQINAYAVVILYMNGVRKNGMFILLISNSFSSHQKKSKQPAKVLKSSHSETPYTKTRSQRKLSLHQKEEEESTLSPLVEEKSSPVNAPTSSPSKVSTSKSPRKKRASQEVEINNWHDNMSEIFVDAPIIVQKGFRLIILDIMDIEMLNTLPSEALSTIEVLCILSVPFTLCFPPGSLRDFNMASSIILPSSPISLYFFVGRNVKEAIALACHNFIMELKGIILCFYSHSNRFNCL